MHTSSEIAKVRLHMQVVFQLVLEILSLLHTIPAASLVLFISTLEMTGSNTAEEYVHPSWYAFKRVLMKYKMPTIVLYS